MQNKLPEEVEVVVGEQQRCVRAGIFISGVGLCLYYGLEIHCKSNISLSVIIFFIHDIRWGFFGCFFLFSPPKYIGTVCHLKGSNCQVTRARSLFLALLIFRLTRQ